MNAVVHAINAAGQAFVAFALPMLIQSAVLVLILLFVDFVLRRRVRAVFRYWIWMLVLLKLVLPPSLCSPVSFGTWFGRTLEAPTAVLDEAPAPEESEMKHGWQPQAQLGDGVPSANPIIQSFAPKAAPPITLVDRQPAREPGPRPKTPPVTVATETDIAPAAPPAPTLSWQALVLLTWAATALAFLLLLLQRAYFVRGLVAQAQEAPPSLLAVLDDCRARMRLNQPVALRISPNASSPAVCGLLRPVVLIPKNLAPKLQPCDLQAVLLHELAHVKRGDLWVNLIQTLLQIVYFYHPLLWLANLMIRRVREQAVDEAVLVAMGDTAHDYPETLLSVAKLAFRKRPALSLRLIGVVESKSALSGRIKHILSRPLPKSARLGVVSLVAIVATAAFLLPMAKAQRHPKQISGIDENLNVSDKSGSLTIRSLHMDPPEGKRSLGVNGATLSVVVENTSDTGTYLGFEYYVDSGTIWGVYSPGASSRAQVSAVPAHWQGTLKYLIHYARFTHNGYIRILLAKCDNLRVGKFIDPEAEVLHDKKYPVFADEGLQTAESGAEPSGCVATLPNGVIVELVGVCEHPSAGKQWWQADGSPLTQAPCEYSGVLFPRPGASESAYEFVVRLANLPDGASVTLKTEPGGTGLADTRPEGLRRLSATLPGDLEQCQLLCDVAAGPWETAASSDGTLFSPLAVRSDPIVFTEGVEWNDGGVTVTVTDDLLEHPYRIVAITKNGDIIESSQEIRFPFVKVRETTAYFRDIPRDQIAEFQLQIRPWTRARFMNVSLRPAQETHVTVHIDPPEGPAELDGNEVAESAPLPLTERANKIMPVAEQEARQLNHSYIGTEHILMALAREKDAVSTQALENLGVNIDTLRAEVGKLLKPGSEPVTKRRLARTPRAKRVMKYAREEARALAHDYIGTEHILLGLMREKEGIAAQVLNGLGLTWQQIRAGVLSLVQSGDARAVERMADGPDTDGDGLSDFQEVHKYLTDPAKQDSDGDGTPDGDWAERREYTYSVRSIFRFLPPLDEKALNDDFQDARVREQTDDYIEIEVVHYPLATVYESIDENRNWQQDDAHLTEYLAPGATTNWDAPMRRALLAELKDDGIDVDALSDKQAVDQVSRWLLKRSRSLNKVFTTFYVHCPNGRPEVFPGLEDAFRREFERDKDNYDWTIEEHFDHEVLGKGMFTNKTHGSCTSTAVYLTTVLRALGIPTRMVLASPAVDASDREQILMVKNSITHNQVRETMLAGLRRSSHGFTNHTFNEVYIGNRWVRLDYTALGPSIFGAHRFGLQTHLYTINDLSDMNLAATWGVRYAKGLRSASFQHSNPYSAIAIDDLFGVHSNVPNPPFTAQEPATSSKPNIFIFSPARVSVWDEVLEIVKDVTFNKTGRPHKREFYENLFEGVWQRKPGDILVLLFALDTEDRIPEGYEDLLIGSWSGIESSLREGMAIEMTNQTRDMKVILIAAPRAAQLESLVRNSSLLRTLGTPEEANEEGVAAEHGASLPAPFSTIQFANGVEVRFLGVCTHPSTGQPWWEPDGTPLETAPYESTGSRLEEQEGYVYYEFAAEILGGDHPSIRWKVPGGTRSSDTGQAIGPDGQHLAHTHAYTANQPLDAEVANVFLGLAADEWETPAVHARPDNEGSYTLKDGHAIAFGSAYEREGQTYVPVTTNIPYTVMAKRLVAIDIEGNLHTGGMSGSGGNVLQSSTYNFDVPLGRIKEFRFQTRPYLWIEFHNVSLRRGQKTDFRVDFAAAYNPDAVDGVTLPDVDRETVMLDLASGELVEIPRGASETNMAEAILALGRGDLVHDGGALILVRNATSEQAENMAGMPFSTYPISPDLPQALQVTTAEGHRYEIKVLAVDEGKSCTLKCTLLSEAEAVSNRVRAELPNGVTVEFLAYSHLVPRGGLFWFDPQGQETTIPGVYEADVEGLGTILALRVQPSEARLTVQVYRGPDAQNIEKQWQLPGTDIWLLALGQERNFANLRVLTEQTLPPVIETIALTEENLGQLVEVNRCGIASIVDLHVLDEAVSEMMMGEMARTMGLPPEYSMDGEMAKSMGLQDMVEPPTLGFSTINAPDSHQSIVALLDKEGRTYPVNQIEGSYPNAIYGARLWPGKLAGIVVEAAPVHSADVRLRNISLTPQRVTEIRIEPDPERQLLWRRSYASLLREILTNSIARYRKDHGGRFPSQLEALRRNHDDDAFRWLLANIAHVGADKSPDDDPRTVIAYDKTLLAQGQGTYVFYSDGQFEFESPLELTELGLLPNSSGPDTWQNMGVSVPSDANDTRSLAPGIWLDGIGSAPDSRVFISTVRDTAETEGRVYRFVLSNKADEVLAPIYYASFEQADGKLWEKYTFDTYYHYRELEAFRLQWRSAAGEVAVAPTGHGEILAAAANAPNLPRALNAPPGQHALTFDGKDDYLYVPDSESLRTAEQLKVEMWFKPQFPPGPYDHRPGWALLAKGAYLGTGRVSNQGFGIVLVKHDDCPNDFAFDFCRTSENSLNMTGVLYRQPHNWMHFSETFQRGSYIPAPGQPLVFGRFLIPSELPFRGQIAEIRLWDAATSGDTAQYEKAPLTGSEPGLLACWTFEEGAGPIARDISPNANHARLGSSITTDDNDPGWLDLGELVRDTPEP